MKKTVARILALALLLSAFSGTAALADESSTRKLSILCSEFVTEDVA